MILLLTALLFLVFVLLALVHFYWALGGTWALEGAMPPEMQAEVNKPGRQIGFRILTALVGFGLLAMGLVMVLNLTYKIQSWEMGYLCWATIGIGGIFALRAIGDFKKTGFFQRGQTGIFAERDKAIYSPLCAGLASGIFLLAYLVS